MKPETDARENTGDDKAETKPDPLEMIIAQNDQMIQLLHSIFWACGGTAAANTNKQMYDSFQQVAKAEVRKAQQKKIVAAAAMPANMPPLPTKK